MRVLVTGGAGFIGSHLARRLAGMGHQTLAVDDYSSARWSNLLDYSGDVMTLDVSGELSPLQRLEPMQVIFHQASITDTTVTDQKKMMQNNVEGFRRILDLAVAWKSRVVWASSASIYGDGKPPTKESAPPRPLNVYAFSKLAMERLAGQYRDKLAQPIVGLRYFNVYGSGEDHKGKFASMIHQLAKQMRAGRRPRIFTPGDQKRDFVYVDDVIAANLKAMESPRGGIFNVGTGEARSFNQVVAELNRVLKTDLQPEYFQNPYSFTQDWTQADLSEAGRGLGYEPKFDLAKGLDAYAATGMLGI